MHGRRVAHLWCVFQLNIFGGIKLALVEWFECSLRPEPDTNMYLVKKKHEYEVIELSTIEKSVHLIPDFGKEIGRTQRAQPRQPHGLDIFERFVINNHLELGIYNTIY